MTLDRKRGFPWTPGEGGGSARENYSERLLSRPTTRQRRFLGALVAGLGLLIAGCVGGDDHPAVSGKRDFVHAPAKVAARPTHHHADVPLEDLKIDRTDAEAGRFVASGPLGPSQVVRVGDVIGKSEAKVHAVYSDRILFEEPIKKATYRGTAKVILETTGNGETKLFRVVPIESLGQQAESLPPKQPFKIKVLPDDVDLPGNPSESGIGTPALRTAR